MPDNQQFVTRADLGADINIDDVGDKLTVRNVITGAGAPAAPPSVQTKPWIYADMTPDPAALYVWDTVGLDWEAAGGTVPAVSLGLTLIVDEAATVVTDGDGRAFYAVPARLNGLNLTGVWAAVPGAVSSSGALTIQIARVRSGAAVDTLSTAITIDVSEFSSLTAATPSVVNAANDDMATGDFLRIDVDGAGTDAEGLQVVMTFTAP